MQVSNLVIKSPLVAKLQNLTWRTVMFSVKGPSAAVLGHCHLPRGSASFSSATSTCWSLMPQPHFLPRGCQTPHYSVLLTSRFPFLTTSLPIFSVKLSNLCSQAFASLLCWPAACPWCPHHRPPLPAVSLAAAQPQCFGWWKRRGTRPGFGRGRSCTCLPWAHTLRCLRDWAACRPGSCHLCLDCSSFSTESSSNTGCDIQGTFVEWMKGTMSSHQPEKKAKWSW